MDSRHNESTLDDFEGWTQIIGADDDFQKKLDATTLEKDLLKKDVEKYLADTIDVLKTVDIAKLNYEKMEANFKNTINKLEKDLRKSALQQVDLVNKNKKLKNKNRHLKKRLKKTARKHSDLEKAESLLLLATNQLLTKAEEYELLITNHKQKNLADNKEYQETLDKLQEATVWADHFEKMTIKRNEEIIQRNAEIIQLKKENGDQQQIIENLSRSEVGFFSPRNPKRSTDTSKNRSPRPS